MISLFKRKKEGDKSELESQAMDDVTQTLLLPLENGSEKTDSQETDETEVSSYMSVGTRKNQQDAVRFEQSGSCTACVVCDGMGGLSGGERASAIAARGMVQHLLENGQSTDIPTEMGRAALRLNEKIKDLRDRENRRIEAGTTLTAVFIRSGELYWCGIGDSHIYLYRDGILRQLNIDHNFGVQLDQMVQEGSITAEEALRHPQRAALTSYLGIQELTLISGNRTPFPLQKDDVLLQCTDGLYRCLSDDSICQLLTATEDLKQASKLLVETALTLPGAHDNTSVLLTKYKG
mgnify:CR=1 FL=1